MSNRWDLSLLHSADGEVTIKISLASKWRTKQINHQSWWVQKDTIGRPPRSRNCQSRRSISLRKMTLTCADSESIIVTVKQLSLIQKPVSIKVSLSLKRLTSLLAWHAFAQHLMSWNLEDSDLLSCVDKEVATLFTKPRLLVTQLATTPSHGLKFQPSRIVKMWQTWESRSSRLADGVKTTLTWLVSQSKTIKVKAQSI